MPEDKSIRGDLELLRYYYKTKELSKLVWIPVSTNLADPLTKPDNPLTVSLQLMLFDGTLPIGIEISETKHSSASLC